MTRHGDSGSGAELHVVTGAFGYSGKYIAARLLNAGRRVRTLTNSPHRRNPFGGAVEAHPYKFDRPDELARSLKGATALYNTYWVRFDHSDFTHSQAVENTVTLFKAAAHAGAGSRLEQGDGVFYRLGVREVGVIEPHPVCIVKGGGPLQRPRQLVGPIELVGMSLHRTPDRIAPMRRIRECASPPAGVKQTGGNVLTGVAEGTRHYVKLSPAAAVPMPGHTPPPLGNGSRTSQLTPPSDLICSISTRLVKQRSSLVKAYEQVDIGVGSILPHPGCWLPNRADRPGPRAQPGDAQTRRRVEPSLPPPRAISRTSPEDGDTRTTKPSSVAPESQPVSTDDRSKSRKPSTMAGEEPGIGGARSERHFIQLGLPAGLPTGSRECGTTNRRPCMTISARAWEPRGLSNRAAPAPDSNVPAPTPAPRGMHRTHGLRRGRDIRCSCPLKTSQ